MSAIARQKLGRITSKYFTRLLAEIVPGVLRPEATAAMESILVMYEKYSHYPLQSDLSPPEGSYPYFEVEKLYCDLIRNTINLERNGVWYKNEHRWVPIADIQCRDTWKPESLELAMRQIALSKPLYRVLLELAKPNESYKYTIVDGIQRINALKSQSFTHVLALCLEIPVYINPWPPGAPYSELKQMALNVDAAITLSGVSMLNVGNVCIMPLHNIIKFCIKRPGTDIGSPPDCELEVKVTEYNNDSKMIYVAGRIFEENREK